MAKGTIRASANSVVASLTHNARVHEVEITVQAGQRSLERAKRQAADWLVAKRHLLERELPARPFVPLRDVVGPSPVGVSLSRSGRSRYFRSTYQSADGAACLKTFTVGPSTQVTAADIDVVGRIACAFHASWLESSRIGARFDPGIWAEWREYFKVELTRLHGRAFIGDPFGGGIAMVPQPWAQPDWDPDTDPIPVPAERCIVEPENAMQSAKAPTISCDWMTGG